MSRRSIPRAAAGATAVLALGLGLLFGHGSSATPTPLGLRASNTNTALDGATVPTDARIRLDSPGTVAVSWTLDGRYQGRDTRAPFDFRLATSPGPHRIKAHIVTESGDKTTYRVRFRTATSPGTKPAIPSRSTGSAAPAPVATPSPDPDTDDNSRSAPDSDDSATVAPSAAAPRSTTPAPARSATVAPGPGSAGVVPAPSPGSAGVGPAPSPGSAGIGPTPGSAGVAPAPAPAVSGDVRRVSGAAQLQAALQAARPGQVIELADGVYSGRFVASVSGTSAQPIVLRGGRGAVLDGGSPSTGTALSLQGASYWWLEGFTVRGAQKGVVLDRSNHDVLSKLDVGQTGMEGVHFRSSSSDNWLQGSDVHNTGRVNAGFGEGVYVGSAKSHWGTYGNSGGMDRSDRNVITANWIHAVTAENIDIKEGTTGGMIYGNVLDGDGMTGAHFADSWVDLKGNGWLVAYNTGRRSGVDGFQTHVQLSGWGRGNVFRSNRLEGDAKGYGINIQRGDSSSGNVVGCDNQVVGAAAGMANLPCR
jgi:hypothetical protein